MDATFKCPSCGNPLPANAPRGLCPQCLMQGAFATQGNDASRFVAPSIEELARHFPALEILECIGQGGMGAVYKARQKQLDRIVALKILPESPEGDVAFSRRFADEARALARLNHSHIVTLYEFGEAEGLFYFLMEYVDGVNLQQLLKSGRLAPEQALAIVPQICEALEFAHQRGIVHRDIKPGNVLLNRSGEVKIADFGVAKIVAGNAEVAHSTAHTTTSADGLTAAGTVMGTPAYMSPEQVAHPLTVDRRADIYSLGVVFYQMLTGELPGEKWEPPSRKVTVDVRLDEVVLRALAREPERRYQEAGALKTELETIARVPLRAPPAKIHSLILIVLTALCFLTLLLSGGVTFYMMGLRNRTDRAHLESMRPVVVETLPLSGSTNVEPGECEIRVRFSKPMADGSWSWTSAWDGSTPPVLTQPHYDRDGHTCIIKVNLEPGRTYGYWINSDKFQGFTDAVGRPAVPYLLIFQTKSNPSL